MDLSSLLTSRTVAWIGLACIVLSALATFWAMVKLSYQQALGRPMPRNALTGTLDVLSELAVNVVGAVSRGLKLGTGEGLFRTTVPLTPVETGAAPGVDTRRVLDAIGKAADVAALDATVRAPAPTKVTTWPAPGMPPFDPGATVNRDLTSDELLQLARVDPEAARRVMQQRVTPDERPALSAADEAAAAARRGRSDG